MRGARCIGAKRTCDEVNARLQRGSPDMNVAVRTSEKRKNRRGLPKQLEPKLNLARSCGRAGVWRQLCRSEGRSQWQRWAA